MGKMIEVHMVDAFTRTVNEGNRAGVVFDADGLTADEMQRIAAFANVSETAFVVGSKDKASHDVEVRYFTPTSEVPICGHATIATHFLRARKYDLGETRVLAKTGIGVLPVDIVRDGGETKVIMTQGTPEMGAVLSQPQKERLLRAMGISEDDLAENLPVQVTSTGHSKVMIRCAIGRPSTEYRPICRCSKISVMKSTAMVFMCSPSRGRTIPIRRMDGCSPPPSA